MGKPKTDRNRDIFAARKAGATVEKLALSYGLAVSTIEHIIRNEH